MIITCHNSVTWPINKIKDPSWFFRNRNFSNFDGFPKSVTDLRKNSSLGLFRRKWRVLEMTHINEKGSQKVTKILNFWVRVGWGCEMRFKIATHTLKTTLSVVSQCLAQNMVQKMTQNWPQNSAALQIRVERGPKPGPDLTQIIFAIGLGIFKSNNLFLKFCDSSMACKVWADFLVFSKMKISWVSNFFQITPSSGDKTYCFLKYHPN